MAIALHFDFISPYAYLAVTDVLRRADARGDEVQLCPILFAGLLNHHGQLGPAEIPAKRQWLAKDTLRAAKRLGIPFGFPASHPFRPLTALRLSLPEVAGDAQRLVVESLFAHGWAHGGEMSDDAALVASLTAAGLDGQALFEKTKLPEVKARLRDATETAISRGVFGVPTMFAPDGTLFWGADRVQDLFDHIDGKLTIDDALATAVLSGKATAQRKR